MATAHAHEERPERPKRLPESPVPPVPRIDKSRPDASTRYSAYRTGLSNHRTGLSEHRTSLSEYRTDLSTHRTDLSSGRSEMSKRRTGMSFQRTRMSAERTLMSVIRTSLSLMGFGFTIYQIFEKLQQAGVVTRADAPRNFGIALVVLGIVMLVIGVVYHLQFMLGLRHERAAMVAEELLHGESRFPRSWTLVTAVVLLAIGIFVIVSMLLDTGPFG